MEHPFLFVNGISVDRSVRKRIRRHVMTGRNVGKTHHRRSRLDLIRDVNRQTSEQNDSADPGNQQVYTTSTECFPIMNDRNLGNPFRDLSFSWEVPVSALGILEECEFRN